jgi:hypothetical protein
MIWVKKTETEYGNYVNSEGKRYTLSWCHKVYSRGNVTEESLGYEPFDSMEDAISQYGLTAYVDPEAEMKGEWIENNSEVVVDVPSEELPTEPSEES